MARQFQDGDLQVWEAFATTGDNGFPKPARIAFRCRTDRSLRPRWLAIDGDKADAEARVMEASDDELRGWFQDASDLN